MMKNIIPDVRSIAPSNLDSVPFIPSIIGSTASPAKYRSFFTMWLLILSGCPASATSPRIIVKSAMFPPKSEPTPSCGFPVSAAVIEMNASGSADTNATSMKLVTNSVSLKYLARCVIDLTAYCDAFIRTMHPIMNTITSLYILHHLVM